MRFKEAHLKDQFRQSSVLLQQIVYDFENLSRFTFGIDPVITRLWDPVEGESGVHPDKRGCDLRNEFQGTMTYSHEEAAYLVGMMNEKWMRNDGYQTCLHHQFQGGPYHFHLQIPLSTKVYENTNYLLKEKYTMEKPYDVKDLGAKLKDKGLELAEDASLLVLDATVDWLVESAQLSENKVDDFIAPLLLAVRPYVKEQVDKIDGKAG